MWKRGSGQRRLEISNKMESFPSYGSRIYFFSLFLRPYYVFSTPLEPSYYFFMLLNQLGAGDNFTSYSYGCWVGL